MNIADTGISLSPDQSSALSQMHSWFSSSPTSPLILKGLAGTGKTTLIREFLSDISSSNYAVCALAGKAASVLQKKGVNAATIHKTIYDFNPYSRRFSLRKSLARDLSLLIIDEASMIPLSIYNDLLSLDIPLLFVGDHGQLEPMGDDPNIMSMPGITLEHIHRQAEDSPILTLAHRIRHFAALAPIDSPTLRISPLPASFPDNAHTHSQIICARNSTCNRINTIVRSQLWESPPEHPLPGDRLICLRNNYTVGVWNGLQASVQHFDPSSSTCTLTTDLNDTLTLRLNLCKPGKVPRWSRDDPEDLTHWAFAYALTCHKAQGSEWPDVLLIDEPMHLWSRERWLYTAITRASSHLTILTPTLR